MNKKWIKTAESTYAFHVDEQEIGTLHIIYNSNDQKGIVKVNNSEIRIKRTGFWKTEIEITSSDNIVIATAYPKKWYANSLYLEYKDKKLILALRNNPLAEWVIIDNDKELLAYGLDTENSSGKVIIKITNSNVEQDYLLDFLLWYLFVPIASENMGDNFLFAIMVSAL